jgi:hypothetical protein
MFVDPQHDKWRIAYKNHSLFNRNDFQASLMREITGDATSNVGASGDRSVVADRNYEFPLAKNLLQQVPNTKPVNGQTLVYNAATNSYGPTSASSSNTGIFSGNGYAYNNTPQTYTLTSGNALTIAISGNSIYVNGNFVALQVPMPYAGTLKNMRMTISVVGPAATYTLTILKNGGGTPFSSVVTVGAGANTINFSDLSSTEAVVAGDGIVYELSSTASSTAIAVFGFSLELS